MTLLAQRMSALVKPTPRRLHPLRRPHGGRSRWRAAWSGLTRQGLALEGG